MPEINRETDKVFSPETLPTDFTASSGSKSFEPLSDGVYQTEVLDVVIKEKPVQYQEENKNKYQVSITLAVLEQGDNYGRRLWDNASPMVYPNSKKGSSKLYKFITAVIGSQMDDDACRGYTTDPKAFYKNLRELIGSQVMVTVEVTTTETGKKRNKVLSYFTPKAKLEKYNDESPVSDSQKLSDEENAKILEELEKSLPDQKL